MSDFNESPDIAIGLHDALTTIIGVLLALGIQPSVFEELFRSQRDRPDAAGVLESLRQFVIDPELQRRRQMIQLIHKEPPAGRA
jgi:hypothetical protein